MKFLIGQLIELATTRKTVAGVYPQGKSSAIVGYGHPKRLYGQLHKVYKLPVHKMVGNEPGKEHKYSNSRKMKPYIQKMVKHLKSNKKLPPMLAMHHPADRKSGIIIDGNHRIHAHRIAGRKFARVNKKFPSSSVSDASFSSFPLLVIERKKWRG
jgi:hypothetical protein